MHLKTGRILKFAVIILFIMGLCACGGREVETETEIKGTDVAEPDVTIQYEDDDAERYSKDESEVPFQVLIDKSALESGFKDSDTVTIVTELTDWDYTVETDYGRITDKSQTSFVYKKPNGQNEDNIIISFVNKENAKEYRAVIPLRYMETNNEVVSSFIPDED